MRAEAGVEILDPGLKATLAVAEAEAAVTAKAQAEFQTRLTAAATNAPAQSPDRRRDGTGPPAPPPGQPGPVNAAKNKKNGPPVTRRAGPTRNPARWISLWLALSVLLVYWPVTHHDFVNYDDQDYVAGNLHVQAGLTPASVAWAFSHPVSGNWHPLTMLSHMLDCQLYGLQPGGHHLTSLLILPATPCWFFCCCAA